MPLCSKPETALPGFPQLYPSLTASGQHWGGQAAHTTDTFTEAQGGSEKNQSGKRV